jgi:sugar/nucleoside kinase (ribokinase family)
MNALFIGLTTLDLIYLAPQPPSSNQKMVASDYTLSAGGPATNAAVAFSHLGNQATLLSVLGGHAVTHLLRADLAPFGIELVDLDPSYTQPPPISSIIVTEATGERAVISINASKTQIPASLTFLSLLQQADLVLIDGHQMAVSHAIAQAAQAQSIPVVVDAGSWKPGFETVLPWADYALCSANFAPPGCHTSAETLAYLYQLGIPQIAITQGERPIVYQMGDHSGEVPVPTIQPVDTLGAGDIFHGAFCHFILRTSFVEALHQAAQVAAKSCQFFGTRRWMEE